MKFIVPVLTERIFFIDQTPLIFNFPTFHAVTSTVLIQPLEDIVKKAFHLLLLLQLVAGATVTSSSAGEQILFLWEKTTPGILSFPPDGFVIGEASFIRYTLRGEILRWQSAGDVEKMMQLELRCESFLL